jgi:hypothetical protein
MAALLSHNIGVLLTSTLSCSSTFVNQIYCFFTECKRLIFSFIHRSHHRLLDLGMLIDRRIVEPNKVTENDVPSVERISIVRVVVSFLRNF